MDIRSLDFADLPDLFPEPAQSHRTHEYEVHHWRKIPLLQDVLHTLPPHVSLIIEFKMSDAVLIAEVHRLIHEASRKHAVYWFSLKDSINNELRLFDPTLPTITSQMGVLRVLMLHYLCLLPFCSLPDQVFGITLNTVSDLTHPVHYIIYLLLAYIHT